MTAWKTRWPLGLALLSFAATCWFGARAGEDFNRWVLTGLWFAVGVIWVVLWRMDARRRARRAAAGSPPQDPIDPTPAGPSPG